MVRINGLTNSSHRADGIGDFRSEGLIAAQQEAAGVVPQPSREPNPEILELIKRIRVSQ